LIVALRRFRLPYRAPYDFAALLAFFERRAIAGIETVDAQSYTRRFAFDGEAGTLRVTQKTNDDALILTVDFPHAARLPEIRARVQRMFDLDADIATINARLGKSTPLRSGIRRHSGQRVPGGWDGFEIAVRAVLGQQISVAAARTLASHLVQNFGASMHCGKMGNIHLFPEAETLVDAELTHIGITRARAATLNAVARAVCAGAVSFDPQQSLDDFVARWTTLPGIGDWTAQYIAMRAMGHADAFPAADLVLRKAVARDGIPVPLRQLQAMAEDWRPFRAYAVLHLWRSTS
jgi:AraC family transcriptional regulator of adaptative response / DNA-3-methyladenine glycosylase II